MVCFSNCIMAVLNSESTLSMKSLEFREKRKITIFHESIFSSFARIFLSTQFTNFASFNCCVLLQAIIFYGVLLSSSINFLTIVLNATFLFASSLNNFNIFIFNNSCFIFNHSYAGSLFSVL